MNKIEAQKRDNYLKKLVSNSKAIISNQVGMPLGIEKMVKFNCWINQIQPLNEIDLSLFMDCYSKLNIYALCSERLHYEKEYLKKEDKQIREVIDPYHDQIIDKCFEIIEKLDNRK